MCLVWSPSTLLAWDQRSTLLGSPFVPCSLCSAQMSNSRICDAGMWPSSFPTLVFMPWPLPPNSLIPLGNLEQSRHGLSKIKAPAMPQYPLINDFLLVFPLRSSFLGHSLSGQRMSPASNWTPSEAVSGFSADKLPVLFHIHMWDGLEVLPGNIEKSSFSLYSLFLPQALEVQALCVDSLCGICWVLLLWNAVWLSPRGTIAQRLVSGFTGWRSVSVRVTSTCLEGVKQA